MSFCEKCNNLTKFINIGDKGYKECRICGNRTDATIDEYHLYTKSLENDKYINPGVVNCNIYPTTIGKNGVMYTIIVKEGTLERLYLSHADKMLYKSIT